MNNTPPDLFKKALSQFATGVCVVTYNHPQEKTIGGVTISAFSSLSLNPAKILFCLGNQGKSHKIFSQVDEFAVNILSHSQLDLAYQFAGDNREGLSDLIKNIETIPCIKETLATIICNKGGVYKEGDHDIVVGEVKNISCLTEDEKPMLYFRSKMMN